MIVYMTILDASNQLFDWFSDNDSFCIKDDWIKLILLSEHKERDEAAVILALDSLEKSELIKSIIVNDETKRKIWILNRPFDQWDQSVSLTGPTARVVSTTVNNFCDLIQDQTDRCDSTNISEKDIRNLAIVCNHYKTIATSEEEGD